ncbi:putative ribonuclease H-like domain-containing protein, partial [Tanacetum coccineum]
LKQSVDARQSEEKNVSTQQYIVFPLWSSISSSYKSSNENVTADDSVGESPIQKPANAIRKEFEAQCNRQNLSGKATKASSTNHFNTVSTPVNAASTSRTYNDGRSSFVPLGGTFPNDPLMSDLEDTVEVQNISIFGSAYDDEDLDTYNSPYADQVMGAKADFNNMEPLTVQEPIKIAQALDDESWVEAMQEELLQFKIQKVWTLVDLPYGKKAIGTKWVHRNKKDERGIVVRNKSRLMDVKSAFLYGTIEEETLSTYLLDNGFFRRQIDKTLFIKRVKGDILLVQMSSMGELTFFLGLQVKQKEDGIFISQDKYVGEILKKFGFSSIRTASTPMETNKALTKDEDGEDVDIHLYRSMIRSLMYLTSSRPDIMFSVCACLRFQVQPKFSHLNVVKRIFRYLNGRPKLGLWYPKDSPFILEDFSDSDYAGASLDRKSITEVLWIQNQMLDYRYNFMQTNIYVDNESVICVVKNHVYHSKTKHIEIRHHFIRDSYEKKLIEMVKIHTDYNVADLLTKAFDVTRLQFLIASIGMLNP